MPLLLTDLEQLSVLNCQVLGCGHRETQQTVRAPTADSSARLRFHPAEEPGDFQLWKAVNSERSALYRGFAQSSSGVTSDHWQRYRPEVLLGGASRLDMCVYCDSKTGVGVSSGRDLEHLEAQFMTPS